MAEKDLKHKPFAALRDAVVTVGAPAAKARPAEVVSPARASFGRVVVREEFDESEGAVITRVIGMPTERLNALGKRWREVLGNVVVIEGRDLLVMASEAERVAALVRDAGAGEVAVVRREAPVAAPAGAARTGAPQADLAQVGEAGGTQRSQIRRGLRVAIVQKVDQGSGALTEGVVSELLTSSPTHPRGIKVRLESGEVGRVRRILSR